MNRLRLRITNYHSDVWFESDTWRWRLCWLTSFGGYIVGEGTAESESHAWGFLRKARDADQSLKAGVQ